MRADLMLFTHTVKRREGVLQQAIRVENLSDVMRYVPVLGRSASLPENTVKRMNATRIVIWPILMISYATLFVAMVHALLGNWSGAASLGMFFVIFVGAPSLACYAGYLRRKKLIRGWVKTEAALCAAVPVAIVLLLAAVAVIGKR